jgi:hypothetical protein
LAGAALADVPAREVRRAGRARPLPVREVLVREVLLRDVLVRDAAVFRAVEPGWEAEPEPAAGWALAGLAVAGLRAAGLRAAGLRAAGLRAGGLRVAEARPAVRRVPRWAAGALASVCSAAGADMGSLQSRPGGAFAGVV